MRRLTVFLCVLSILLFSASSAFALGDGSRNMRYAPVWWDAIYSDMVGGGFELPFNYFNKGTPTTYFRAGATSENSVALYRGAVTSWGEDGTNFYGYVVMPGENFTLVGYDQVVDVERCDGYEIALSTDARFKSVRVYGSYYVLEMNSSGNYELVSHSFSYTKQFGSTVTISFDLGRLLYDALPDEAYVGGYVYFDTLSVDLAVYRNTVDTPKLDFWGGEGTYLPYMIDPGGFMTLSLLDIETEITVVEPQFEIGTFLSETVGGFMSVPLFGGITFGGLLGTFLGLVFILWFIKVIK